MNSSDYKNLKVWQLAIDIVDDVYKINKILPAEERFCISDQMRRSAISIPSNIAEGQARNSAKEFIRFLLIAKGSIAELETQLIICNRLLYLDQSTLIKICSKLAEASRMIKSLINSIEKTLIKP